MAVEQRNHDRALEPLAQCLIRHLIIPQIYLEADWPAPPHRVDLLAIDRAGKGDPHVVEVKVDASAAFAAIPHLLKISASYRWIAFFKETMTPEMSRSLMNPEPFYAHTGPGRIGVIEITRAGDNDLKAGIALKAEHFPETYFKEADRFTAENEPTFRF